MKEDLNKFVSEIQKVLKPLTDAAKKFNAFLESNPEFLKKVGHYLKNWPDYHKKDWAELASYGWFLNGETPIAVEVALKEGKASVDRFMVAHLRDDWAMLVIESSPRIQKGSMCWKWLLGCTKMATTLPVFRYSYRRLMAFVLRISAHSCFPITRVEQCASNNR